MIDIKQLRVGNLIYGGKGIDLIFDVQPQDFETIEKYPHNYLSIPLTEELLIKCGFEKQMSWTFKIDLIGNKYLVYYLGEKGWSIGNKDYSDFDCKYLHQLQNLYFALTNKELEVNL